MATKITTKTKAPEVHLQQLYLKTEQSLIDEIFRKRAQGYVDYAEVAALERVQNTLQGMIDESFVYVPKMIEKRFYGGSGASGGYANAASLSAVQTAVEEQLIDALLANVMSAAEKAYETSRTLYRLARLDDDELRQAALESTAYAEALGKGSYTSAQLMEVNIRNHGITAFVDKAGRNWSLASYCSMATRTTARQAQVAALLTKDDHDLYRIVPHASSCPICAPLQGRVYSKSGTDPNYPPLAIAFGKIDPAGSDDLSNTYLNIHPSCLCSIVRYTEIGKTDKEIETMRRFSNPETNPLDIDPRSKKEIEAYKEKERNRARLLRERRKEQEKHIEKALGEGIIEGTEKQGEKAVRFLRFGRIPPNGQSVNYLKMSFRQNEEFTENMRYGDDFITALKGAVGENYADYLEDGISAFEMDKDGLPKLENLQQVSSLAGRLDSKLFEITGSAIGKGQDLEPLVTVEGAKEKQVDKAALIEKIEKTLRENYEEVREDESFVPGEENPRLFKFYYNHYGKGEPRYPEGTEYIVFNGKEYTKPKEGWSDKLGV